MKPKKNIETLKSYHVNESKYHVKLDANESNNFLFEHSSLSDLKGINLYPDNEASQLKDKIIQLYPITKKEVTFGNGSSELLDLLVKSYVNPKEVILSFEPSFSMYPIYAALYDATYIPVPSEKDFSLSIDLMISYAHKFHPKLIFICSPNNPTGYLIPKKDIVKLISSTEAMVLVDEAYMEFSSVENSLVSEINQYKNLVIVRTFSKAFGLAGIRLGYMIASKDIIDVIEKVKAPYALNTLSQTLGLKALDNYERVLKHVSEVKKRRETLSQSLKDLGFKVYPSEGNFVFTYVTIPNLDEKLIQKGILIRAFSNTLNNYYRITVGTSEAHDILIQALKEIKDEKLSD